MGHRRRLDSVADGTARAFASRNNDVNGWWVMGLLLEAVPPADPDYQIDLLTGRSVPELSNGLGSLGVAWGRYLRWSLDRHRVSLDMVAGGILTVRFDRARHVGSWIPGGRDHPFSCTTTLTDDIGRAHERSIAGHCSSPDGFVAPDPDRRPRRSSFNVDPRIVDRLKTRSSTPWTIFDLAPSRNMLGWNHVARILASERDVALLEAMGIPQPTGDTKSFARHHLDGLEEFYSWDDGPDGLRKVIAFERELLELAGPDALAGLVDAAAILSLSVEESYNLDAWQDRLGELWDGRHTEIVVPPGLAERVKTVLVTTGWPRSPQIRTRPGESIEDAWEWNYWSEEPSIDPEAFTDTVIRVRHTRRVLEALATELSQGERDVLVRWANSEVDAYQDEPRPAHWPVHPPLALP